MQPVEAVKKHAATFRFLSIRSKRVQIALPRTRRRFLALCYAT